jgi:hypothetical protein
VNYLVHTHILCLHLNTLNLVSTVHATDVLFNVRQINIQHVFVFTLNSAGANYAPTRHRRHINIPHYTFDVLRYFQILALNAAYLQKTPNEVHTE